MLVLLLLLLLLALVLALALVLVLVLVLVLQQLLVGSTSGTTRSRTIIRRTPRTAAPGEHSAGQRGKRHRQWTPTCAVR